MPSVLIVDDLVSIHELLGAVIQSMGFAISFATDGETALARYKAEHHDLVLTDIDMKPTGGITLLQKLKLYDPNVVVVIMTAYASTDSAVQALKLGAFDYLQKPFRVDDLMATLRRGLEVGKAHAARETSQTAPDAGMAGVEEQIIGKSAAMTKLILHVKKLIRGRTPVLLVGEKSTGKRLVAEVLHRTSGATAESFVRVDCSQGSEKSFREGLCGPNGAAGPWVTQARDGTLFLQNLHCLSEPGQRELAGVLRHSAHGFRLVCTTSEDLERFVGEKTFHDELFYRVASLPIHLPPLRARAGDIPLLAKHYAAHVANPFLDGRLIEFADDAIAVMTTYPWPGNLAELHQVVSKIAATTETRVITAQHLPLRLRDLGQWPALAEYLACYERQYVSLVLQACNGVKTTAARVLGVDANKLA